MKEVQSMEAEKIKAMKEALEVIRKKGITLEDFFYALSQMDEEQVIKQKKEMNIEDLIFDMFVELGVPPNVKGHDFLTYAIIYFYEKPESFQGMTKELYPAVAKKFNTTSNKAERAIRHAIETAWNRGNVDVFEKYFGYTINERKGKPTNSEFIATISKWITRKVRDNC